jgi:hypothetical protein
MWRLQINWSKHSKMHNVLIFVNFWCVFDKLNDEKATHVPICNKKAAQLFLSLNICILLLAFGLDIWPGNLHPRMLNSIAARRAHIIGSLKVCEQISLSGPSTKAVRVARWTEKWDESAKAPSRIRPVEHRGILLQCGGLCVHGFFSKRLLYFFISNSALAIFVVNNLDFSTFQVSFELFKYVQKPKSHYFARSAW